MAEQAATTLKSSMIIDERGSTHAIRILRSETPIDVQAIEASDGLYVYELPAAVNPDDLYRWRIGHHTGLAIAIAESKQDALAGAAAITELADWAQGTAVLASVSVVDLAVRLRRFRCYRAGY